METTHQLLHVTPSSSKITVPFYAPPRSCKKTSTEIISEARAAIARECATNLSISSTRMAASIRPVNTKRPFTPRDKERTLFGRSKKSTYRPPSSFSLDCLQFQEQDHVAVTPPHMTKLNPLPVCSSSLANLDTSSSSANFVMWKRLFHNDGSALGLSCYAAPLSASTTNLSKLKLPSIHWTAKPQSRWNQFSTTGSLVNLPEELEDENEIAEDELPPTRKAYSSPTQRTQSVLDDEFVVDVSVRPVPPLTTKNTQSHLKIGKDSCPDVTLSKKEDSNNCDGLFPSPSKLTSLQRKETHAGAENSEDKNSYTDINEKETVCNKKLGVSVKCVDNVNSRSTLSFNDADEKLKSEDKDKFSSLAKLKDPYTVTFDKHKFFDGKEKPLLPLTNVLRDFPPENSEAFLKPAAVSDKSYLTNTSVAKGKAGSNESLCDKNSTKLKNEVSEFLLSDLVTEGDKKESVQTILKEISSLLGHAGEDRETLPIDMLQKLFLHLEKEGIIGNKSCNTKLKSQVLKVLYEFVEVSSDAVLLEIARIVLALHVTGSNLSGVCKLIFKVSRNDKNDKLFLSGNVLELFVEALGCVSPVDDAEACVYGYGALKFLTMNNVLLQKVLRLGILELMVLHMKIVNVSRQESASIPEQTNHTLFQLTGALRNVAGEEDMHARFIETGTVKELCTSLELFSSDLDVVSNISRTFSVISAHDDCCTAIVDQDHIFSVFVKLIQKYPGHQDIIVRLGYALGNLMAKSDAARRKFFNEEGAMSSLLSLLNIYMEKDKEIFETPKLQYQASHINAGSSGSVEDVIIKTIRIIANMSINAVVGNTLMWDLQHTIPTKGGCVNVQEGGQLLDILLSLLQQKSVEDSGELVHSVLSTLNNLSYYPCSNTSILSDRQLEIAQVLYSILKTTNLECLIEANRVCGNLTRSKDVRDFFLDIGGMEQLLKFLKSTDHELLCTTVGILINMMADWDKRLAFRQENGIRRMIDALRSHGEDDWLLATLICQALWNYCIESPDLYSAFSSEYINDLLEILADFLDEERLFGIEEGCEASESIKNMASYQAWEEFSGVATDLLERLEAFLDSLQPSEGIIANSDVQEECYLEPLYMPDVSV